MKRLLAVTVLLASTFGAYGAKPDKQPSLDATAQWLLDSAVVLNGVEAGQGFADMQGLNAIVGDARIVSVGEATHGSREFFQLKHRMLEYLVTQKGFNLFAIEATMPEAFVLNDYVLNDVGDPAKALAGLYFWTWDTEEVLTMIHWMRNYNAEANNINKLKFYGFDMQSGTVAFKQVSQYLNTVSSGVLANVAADSSINLLKNDYQAATFRALPAEQIQSAVDTAQAILADLATNKTVYIEKTSAEQWAIAHQIATVLKQTTTLALVGSNGADYAAHRDLSMAQNAAWALEHEGPEAKMMIWAHNNHVKTNTYGSGYSMGHHLRGMYGQQMVNFGLMFNQGGFQSYRVASDEFGELTELEIGPLGKSSLDAKLHDTGLSYAAFDLRTIVQGTSAARWFNKVRDTRSIGSMFTVGSDPVVYLNAPENFDALLYVDSTTPARANPGNRVAVGSLSPATANLDFELPQQGTLLSGWRINQPMLANFDYSVSLSDQTTHQGNSSLMVSREPGIRYGERAARFNQMVDATAYRGKHIKLSAAVKVNPGDDTSKAFLWLYVKKFNGTSQPTLFKDNMADRPIDGQTWQTYTIEADVADDAVWIDFGGAFAGEGQAWFDSFAIEVIEP